MTVASLVTGSGMCKAGTRTGRTQEGPRKDPVPVSLVLSHWCVLHHEVGPATLRDLVISWSVMLRESGPFALNYLIFFIIRYPIFLY